VLFALLIMATVHFLLFGAFLPLEAQPYRWWWLALSGLLGLVVGDSGLFQAFVLIGPRLATLIMALVPIFSTFLGWLVFSEVVTTVELAGPGRSRVADKQYTLGILFGLMGALGQASGLIAAKFGLVGDFPPASANVIRLLVATLVLWGVAALRGRLGYTVKQWQHKKASAFILAGTLFGPVIGVWLSLTAIQLTRVGIAATLMALTPIILIPLSFLIFNERVTLRSIVGTIAAVAGVALIFL
jgi:drug/metabolite transporter (DMT)-like permease